MVTQPLDSMKYIWDEVSQLAPDGKRHIRYRSDGDLRYLYRTGFVDTEKFGLEEWIDAFRDSRQSDGSYLVNESQWMAKKKYHYEGPVDSPLDPNSLEEKGWELDEFEKLLRERVLPSTTVAEEHFRKGIEKARKTAIVDGKFQINKAFKFSLKQLLLNYPSPRRLRELAVSEARKKLNAPREPVTSKITPSETKTRKEQSGYQKGPSKERTASDQLSRLLWKGQK